LHFPIYFEGRPYNTHTTVWVWYNELLAKNRKFWPPPLI